MEIHPQRQALVFESLSLEASMRFYEELDNYRTDFGDDYIEALCDDAADLMAEDPYLEHFLNDCAFLAVKGEDLDASSNDRTDAEEAFMWGGQVEYFAMRLQADCVGVAVPRCKSAYPDFYLQGMSKVLKGQKLNYGPRYTRRDTFERDKNLIELLEHLEFELTRPAYSHLYYAGAGLVRGIINFTYTLETLRNHYDNPYLTPSERRVLKKASRKLKRPSN